MLRVAGVPINGKLVLQVNKLSLNFIKIGLIIFTGTITSRVLAALDALDRHRFDRMDATNSLDTLYSKVCLFKTEFLLVN